MTPVPIIYFSDVLCIWAYIAERRVKALKDAFGDQVQFEHRFCSVFGDTERKMATAWRDRGGYTGFNAHLREVASRFPDIPVNPDLWLDVKPASSTGAHLFLKSVQLDEADGQLAPGTMDRALIAMRDAFFQEARDIGQWQVQCEVGQKAGADLARIELLIHNGRAFAALASDYESASTMNIQGSPSFVLNEGRQKLYGNVGYRILEANIQELLRTQPSDQASWC
jgi:predicted DsbA family dithiol-disulfide isomerase